jgi:hypothetical protein
MVVFWFIAPEATLPIDKLIQGMIYGASVSGFHKLGAQSVFGNDARVKKLKAIVGGVVPHKPINPTIPPAGG